LRETYACKGEFRKATVGLAGSVGSAGELAEHDPAATQVKPVLGNDVGTDAVDDAFAIPLGLDHPGQPHAAKMMGHPLLGQPGRRADVPDAERPANESAHDKHPVRVRQHLQRVGAVVHAGAHGPGRERGTGCFFGILGHARLANQNVSVTSILRRNNGRKEPSAKPA